MFGIQTWEGGTFLKAGKGRKRPEKAGKGRKRPEKAGKEFYE
jgi:hypothetical protein